MDFITILTPTFNRSNLLKRTYDSLKAQSRKNFVWMIVDDGSSDNTSKLVNQWIDEGELRIEYMWQENKGKHIAHNLGILSVKTDLVLLHLDSDDWLIPNAIEIIYNYWKLEFSDQSVGIVFCNHDENGQNLTIMHHYNDLRNNSYSLKYAIAKRWLCGEATFVLRTNYAKQYLFPAYENENFCTESIIWVQMDMPFIWSNKSLYVREYQQAGLTNRKWNLLANNPYSFMIAFNMRSELYYNFLFQLTNAILYTLMSVFLKNKNFILEARRPILVALLLPASLCVYPLFKLVVHINSKHQTMSPK